MLLYKQGGFILNRSIFYAQQTFCMYIEMSDVVIHTNLQLTMRLFRRIISEPKQTKPRKDTVCQNERLKK